MGESVTLSVASAFTDPDGDALTYTAMSSSAGVAGVAVSGTNVTITAVATGTTTVTVTATDPGGLSAAASISVVVTPPNRPPVVSDTIPDQLLTGGQTVLVNVARLFTDPDGDTLTYTAATSDSGVAQATPSVSDGMVTVQALAAGTATITVTARDSGDLTAALRFSVMVTDPPSRDHHAALVESLPERPFEDVSLSEDNNGTYGTLRLASFDEAVFPVVVVEPSRDDPFDSGSVLVAGSFLGAGRVVAFSGQDFVGSRERSTLVGHAAADRLMANAVRWAGGGDGGEPSAVLVDNPRVGQALTARGFDDVRVAQILGRSTRDWSADALRDIDVAVVQVNEWGTHHLSAEHVEALRAFVEAGGGLVVAGSALHWHWWLADRLGAFPGDLLLDGAGISWNTDRLEAIDRASTRVAPAANSTRSIWQAYLNGLPLDAVRADILPAIFEAAREKGRLAELDAALSRLVTGTPPLPASAAIPAARLAAEVASTLGPHEWPETLPWAATFPGLPAARARREDGSVTVNATWSEFPVGARRGERHFPLGFYAPPGGLVTISVPAQHAVGDLSIAVGQDHDDLLGYRGNARHDSWRRGPNVRRTFDVANGESAVTNAYGGSIALVVPDHYAGTIPVTVRGAIPMAVYTAGRSTDASWRAALDRGAPQAIIQTLGGIRLVVSAGEARRGDGPGAVARFWEGFREHHAELAGEPAPRAYESIWIFDPHVGYGYANAGPLRINYPLDVEKWVLSPETASVRWWLFGHELGHQYQTRDWAAEGIGEVAVNLFTMYTLNFYIYGGGEREMRAPHPSLRPVDHSALALARWPSADVFGKLDLYRQLIHEFGWEPMRQVFRGYYDPAYPRTTYGSELDGFAIRFSAVVERDLASFFRHWVYPLSPAAEATIRGFGYQEWLPPGW